MRLLMLVTAPQTVLGAISTLMINNTSSTSMTWVQSLDQMGSMSWILTITTVDSTECKSLVFVKTIAQEVNYLPY